MSTAFILDTDAGTDVDDALAIAFAVRHPNLDIKAITTVSGDTVRRARIAKKLLVLAGRDDIEVAAGVRGDEDRPSEGGHEDAMLGPWHDDLELADRDGVTLLMEECAEHHYEVCTVGMQSNVAAALERDPSFAADVPRLIVMGGVFARPKLLDHDLTPGVDHNLNVDRQASLRALNAGIPTLYTPCDVSSCSRTSTASATETHSAVSSLARSTLSSDAANAPSRRVTSASCTTRWPSPR
jgi:purine nucleosidase